jgi:hypothetical protein
LNAGCDLFALNGFHIPSDQHVASMAPPLSFKAIRTLSLLSCMWKTASVVVATPRYSPSLLPLLLSPVDTNSVGLIRADETHVQISQAPGMSIEGDASIWSVAFADTCNGLRCIDPFAGDLL